MSVYLAGQGLDRISRSLQDRRLNRLVRGKYGRAGDRGVHDLRKYCDNTLVRSLGIAVAVFKEEVTPCPILVCPLYFVSFYYLRLSDWFYLAFGGR